MRFQSDATGIKDGQIQTAYNEKGIEGLKTLSLDTIRTKYNGTLYIIDSFWSITGEYGNKASFISTKRTNKMETVNKYNLYKSDANLFIGEGATQWNNTVSELLEMIYPQKEIDENRINY